MYKTSCCKQISTQLWPLNWSPVQYVPKNLFTLIDSLADLNETKLNMGKGNEGNQHLTSSPQCQVKSFSMEKGAKRLVFSLALQ